MTASSSSVAGYDICGDWTPLAAPCLSGDGMWSMLSGSGSISFPFVGRAVDVYWLSRSDCGCIKCKSTPAIPGIGGPLHPRAIRAGRAAHGLPENLAEIRRFLIAYA